MLAKIKHNFAVFGVFLVASFLLSMLTQMLFTHYSGSRSVEKGDYSQFAAADQVVVYHSPKCPVCGNLKQYFDHVGFKYIEKNIDTSDVFATEFESLGFKSIPLIVTSDKVVIGFNKSEVDKLINLYQ